MRSPLQRPPSCLSLRVHPGGCYQAVGHFLQHQRHSSIPVPAAKTNGALTFVLPALRRSNRARRAQLVRVNRNQLTARKQKLPVLRAVGTLPTSPQPWLRKTARWWPPTGPTLCSTTRKASRSSTPCSRPGSCGSTTRPCSQSVPPRRTGRRTCKRCVHSLGKWPGKDVLPAPEKQPGSSSLRLAWFVQALAAAVPQPGLWCARAIVWSSGCTKPAHGRAESGDPNKLGLLHRRLAGHVN